MQPGTKSAVAVRALEDGISDLLTATGDLEAISAPIATTLMGLVLSRIEQTLAIGDTTRGSHATVAARWTWRWWRSHRGVPARASITDD